MASGEDGSAEGVRESRWASIRFLLLLVVAALALRSFVFAPFSIPSGSMLPSLRIGDYLVASKWPWGFSRYSIPFGLASFEDRIFPRLPARGDIAVFRHPTNGEDYVKRVIGLPGDRIALRSGTVILNGAPIARRRIADFAMPVSPNSPCRITGFHPDVREEEIEGRGLICFYPRFRETLRDGRSWDVLDQGDRQLDHMAPIIVPAGHVFVMGDNRDDSGDSRLAVEENGIGLLPIDRLLGRASFLVWSTDGSARWLAPWTWFSAARGERIGRGL